ncbi:hypothetical protein Btru_005517 [Bulinus truncatus]|nr:hypothetical protein Btru_005517 [Bulinus truncatus]
MDSSEYDRLDRRQRRLSDDVKDSYDRLGPGTLADNQPPDTDRLERSISRARNKNNKDVSNLAYEENELQCESGRSTVIKSRGCGGAEEPAHSEDTPLTKLSSDQGQTHTADLSAVEEDVYCMEKTDSLIGKSKDKMLLEVKSGAFVSTTSSVTAPRHKKRSLAQSYDVAKPI